jgi:P pilus assembly chaperone PapD
MKISYIISSSALLFISKIAMAAYILSPSFVEISVDPKYQRPEVRSFYIDNKNKEPIALEIVITKRIVKPDGSMENIPVPDKEIEGILSVYPKQFLVKPEERRTVRVTYRGPKEISKEDNYRFTVRRILVDQSKAKAQAKTKSTLDLVIDVMGSIYVMPKSGKADIQVVSFKKEKGKSNDELHLILTNKGNVHLLVQNYELEVAYIDENGEEKKTTLKSLDISREDGDYFMKSRTNILPEAKRELSFPLKNLKVKQFKNVSIRINN